MTNEDLLRKTLNSTIERLGKQAISYEAEIANLNSQIIMLSEKEESSNNPAPPSKKENNKDS
tara:strand:+ start:968 stop:1153 length:186 start_codon:yes stop_codon:yes gene_type:complete